MIFYFFALLTSGIVLLAGNPRHTSNRWAALFLVSASIGGLEGTVRNAGWQRLGDAFVYVNQTCTPYFILIFSLVYAGCLPRSVAGKWLLKAVLLLPALCMLALTPMQPAMEINFPLLLCWVGPYYMAACYLLLRALWKEEDAQRKRNRLLTTLIIVPTVLAVLVFINVARAIRPDFDFFTYISIFIIYSLAMALLCVFMYGFLGVKLRIEQDPLDATMKAVSSGTALLNHTIKNEIGKISLSAHNLRYQLAEADEETRQHLAIIGQSSQHMLDMVTRIHHQTKTIVLHERPCELDVLVQDCLAHYAVLLEEKGITTVFVPLERPVLMIDAIQIREVLGNLFMNAMEAMEAMEAGGHLQIVLDGDKRHVTLTVADNGPGIPKEQLRRVMEPFYSTKSRIDNYGLGLSYAYNVMQLSGGTLRVTSEAGEGTRATLTFPRKKQRKR